MIIFLVQNPHCWTKKEYMYIMNLFIQYLSESVRIYITHWILID